MEIADELVTVAPGNGTDPVVAAAAVGTAGDTRNVPSEARARHETFFQANLARIAAKNPPLALGLQEQPLVNVQLATNAAGALVGNVWDIASQRWVTLCHPETPWDEAEADAEALYTTQAKIFILLGLGLGYFACAMAKRLRPYQRMAVFESRSSLYAAAMRAVDLSPLLGDRRVDTFIGENLDASLQQWMLGMESHEKFHMAQPLRCGFTQFCDAGVYEGLIARSLEMFRFHQVGLATWAQFGKCIGDNDLANLPELCVSPGMEQFRDAWAGRPVVCVAAGPSLSKNLYLLLDPTLRRKVGVICVGTCYALLKSLGIQPDLVTTIDFQELNWGDQFAGVPLDQDTPLLYLHSTYPTTPRVWPGPRYVALNASDTTGWLAQFCETKPGASMVQTVAHLNLVAAYFLGASSVYLLGQDLSMPIDAHHALGARVQDQAPAEQAAEAHVQDLDFSGAPVYTRHSFLSMRTVFGQLIAQHPQVAVVNCTEGGLALQGAPNKPLAECLQALPDLEGPTLGQRLRERFAAYVPQVRWDELCQGLHSLEAQISGLRAAADEVVALTEGGMPDDLGPLLAYDQIPGQFPLAFNQLAVRRFDLVQMLSEIPLPDGTTALEMQRHTAERLRTIAVAIQEEMPGLHTLLEQTMARVHDVERAWQPVPPGAAALLGLDGFCERQSYAALDRALQQGLSLGERLVFLRLLQRLRAAQQCYPDAAVLARVLGEDPGVYYAAQDVFRRAAHQLRLHYYTHACQVALPAIVAAPDPAPGVPVSIPFPRIE